MITQFPDFFNTHVTVVNVVNLFAHVLTLAHLFQTFVRYALNLFGHECDLAQTFSNNFGYLPRSFSKRLGRLSDSYLTSSDFVRKCSDM